MATPVKVPKDVVEMNFALSKIPSLIGMLHENHHTATYNKAGEVGGFASKFFWFGRPEAVGCRRLPVRI